MPAKKKAGKGAKKRGVLDVVALERERVEAAERRRRQLAMLQSRLRELVEHEKSLQATAASEVEARWIAFLRECKHKALVRDIALLRREFDATLDRKNAAIAMLFADLDEVEEQHAQVHRAHMDTVDALLTLHTRHVAALERDFARDVAEMRDDFALERAELERKHAVEMANLRLIVHNLATEAEELERKLQEELSETHETAMEKMDEDKKQMQAELGKVSEATRAELEARYKDFMATAQVNMKEYMDKSKEDQETTQRIEQQLKRLDKLQENVTAWRTNLARNARDWETRNAAIQAERDATLQHLKRLKHKMQTWRQKQARQLGELVQDARDCEVVLDATATKAERILRLVELCKPLETERELVLTYEANISPAAIETEVKRRATALEPGAVQTDEDVALGPAAAASWQFLERFWLKHNKVVLDNAAIAQERHHLEHENAQLQTLLKQYLDDISVNDSVMRSEHNALLQARTLPPSVAQVANATPSSSNGGRSGGGARGRYVYNTVIEANKLVADAARQGVRR